MSQLAAVVDEENKMGLCPICKVNYITEDENVCSTCMAESDLTEEEIDKLYGGTEAGEETEEVEDEDDEEEDELEILGMQIEDEDEPAEEEVQSADPLDDFDDSLDDDEEEEDDEEQDDLDDDEEDFK
jgi:hypothetical protein